MKQEKTHPLSRTVRRQTMEPFFIGFEFPPHFATLLGIALDPSGKLRNDHYSALAVLALTLLTLSYPKALLALALAEGVSDDIDDIDAHVYSFVSALPDRDGWVDFRELHCNILELSVPWPLAFGNLKKHSCDEPGDYVRRTCGSRGAVQVCVSESVALKYFMQASGHRGNAISRLLIARHIASFPDDMSAWNAVVKVLSGNQQCSE